MVWQKCQISLFNLCCMQQLILNEEERLTIGSDPVRDFYLRRVKNICNKLEHK